MEFYLNGVKKNYQGSGDLNLLKYLREIENITTAKDGCSCEGTCGACTVEIDGKAKLACKTKMSSLEHKHVITTDGLELKIQEAFAHAFVARGGIQCGFCIPGIVMSARSLLRTNPSPTDLEIKKAISKNLCRCTGYVKIVESIQYAAKIINGEIAIAESKSDGKVGSSLGKYDSKDRVLGKSKFVCDYKERGMLHGALKFSDHPRAIIKSLDVSKAEKLSGVVKIILASDVPGNRMTGLIIKDWPMFVATGETTRYLGDVLASVIATTEDIAREAVRLIDVAYEVLTPVSTVSEALSVDAPKIHSSGNILSVSKIKRGDVNNAFKNAMYSVKGTYYTQRIEHAFIETECALARPWDKGEIELLSQGQGVYVDRDGVAAILGIPKDKINVIQVQNGGGFGGKEDLSVQGHASLGCYLTKRPVRFFLTRPESLVMHPKRHPLKMDYELCCDDQGILTGLRANIVGDTGAYASVGMKVLERAAGHATGAYQILNVDIEATSVYTNNVPCGAMRGFGVNQTAFAIESSIDELCRLGGIDRWEIRYSNALREGAETATGQRLVGGVGVRDSLMAIKNDFYNARYAGIACGIKNTGIGNGVPDIGRAKIVIESEDKIIIHHGWTEMGQGVHTMAIQTFCEETGLSPDKIKVVVETCNDTECGMTTSSRGTSLVGNGVIEACKQLKLDLKNKTVKDLVGQVYKGEWVCSFTTEAGAEPAGVDPVTHYSYSYAAQLVILNDDGTIKKIVAAHDAGKIMNPTLFQGQIEGSVHMGLGYALSEDFPMEDARPVHTKLGKCGILRATEVPIIEVVGVEARDKYGPYGAKGVGEVGLVPTAAAVANSFAIYDGKRRTSLPLELPQSK